MGTSKIVIKNLFGIQEEALGGESVELSGPKGSGKTRTLCHQQAELFALWWYGKNDCQIAEAMGVTPSAIWQWRRKNDLPPNCERGRQW